MTRTHAWAVVDRDGELMAPSFDERLWIFEEMHKEQAEACCIVNNGERVVRVVIEIVE